MSLNKTLKCLDVWLFLHDVKIIREIMHSRSGNVATTLEPISPNVTVLQSFPLDKNDSLNLQFF